MIKVGDQVHLLRDTIPTHPVTTVVQVDDAAGRAQIRFERPSREPYAYLFWRSIQDMIPMEEVQHGKGIATYTRPDPGP